MTEDGDRLERYLLAIAEAHYDEAHVGAHVTDQWHRDLADGDIEADGLAFIARDRDRRYAAKVTGWRRAEAEFLLLAVLLDRTNDLPVPLVDAAERDQPVS